MVDIDKDIEPASLGPQLHRLWDLSGPKVKRLCTAYPSDAGTPVYTVAGKYTARGWTEWTEGFLYGWAILHFDATGDTDALELGRNLTRDRMARHLTHTGVHDHGFNNVSTYGNLRRLMLEGRISMDPWELAFYEQALRVSGAVQAARWSPTAAGGGYIYSFNGPHSLFCDTIRSVRSLMLAHRLGHVLMGENDRRISLLERGIEHAGATAEHSVYYGEDRDIYDIWGRVAHESTFNVTDGTYRAPGTQQGYSPFSTWTRGLAWVVTGFAELLEFLETVDDEALEPFGGRAQIESSWLRAARATSDFYIDQTPTDGIPYWDTGAPGLTKLGDYLSRPAEPANAYEPVDSSAAAIAAQGLLRLGRYLSIREDPDGPRYTQAGLTVLERLLSDDYLSTDADHEGLLLHGLYHRPRGWDRDGSGVPSGESVLWGDYHLVELALYVQRMADDDPYYTFFGGGES
ncbi:MAG: glycoside hydrolase family 88 protein [Acidimicrobiia bacterium]|nr:MAG: glycoside hydrolase family 88 protein [Acidimicrobiia bacterium]